MRELLHLLGLALLVLLRPSAAGWPVNLCDTRWFTQPFNHFSFNPASERTYKQRVLSHLGFWKRSSLGANGPIFFYFGNEANVELYVDHTGLMWENAAKFGAALVFAEHRFYGAALRTLTLTPRPARARCGFQASRAWTTIAAWRT
jgi:hypothetical protein